MTKKPIYICVSSFPHIIIILSLRDLFLSAVLLDHFEDLGGRAVVDAVIEVDDLFQASLRGLVLAVDSVVVLVQPILVLCAVVVVALLLDLHGGVDQVLLFFLLILGFHLGNNLLYFIHDEEKRCSW